MQQKHIFLFLALTISLLVNGCSYLGLSSGNQILSRITPYKAKVVQGNFISNEQLQHVQPGMSKHQVQAVLGTPLLINAFNDNYWYYVFSVNNYNKDVQRQLEIVFNNDKLLKINTSSLPQESESAALINPSPIKNKAVKTSLTDLESEAVINKAKLFNEKIVNDETIDNEAEIQQNTIPNYPPLEQ